MFEGLKDKLKDDVRNRFDAWLSGKINARWYHGWSEEGFRDCFVFKFKINGQHQRLYGFLCNPRLNERHFQMCILTSHTTKNEHLADKSEKQRMNELKKDERILQTVKNPKKNCFDKK